MTLTNEDIEVIRKAIREENEPLRDAVRQVIKEQIYIISKVDEMERNVYAIMHFLKLSTRTRDLEKTLHDLD